MKQLVFGSSSIFLSLENELKILSSKEIHEKGGLALKLAVSKPLTLYQGFFVLFFVVPCVAATTKVK